MLQERANSPRERAMFAILCFVWGTTWLAMKVGIATVPPGFFAGTRWTVAGLALLLYRALPVTRSPCRSACAAG